MEPAGMGTSVGSRSPEYSSRQVRHLDKKGVFLLFLKSLLIHMNK